jgi:hypothetical protein
MLLTKPLESDEQDPSADGMGAFGDFVLRKMMRRQLADLQQHAAAAAAAAAADLLTPAAEHGGGSDELKHAVQEQACWLHCVDARDLGDRVLAPKDVFSSKGEEEEAACGASAASGRRWALAPAGVAGVATAGVAGFAGVTGASGTVEVGVEEALGTRWEALLTAEERGLLQQV